MSLISSDGVEPERRMQPDRRGAARRSGADRRMDSRRAVRRSAVNSERRSRERRRRQRRGVFDRRSWIGRRFTDRRGTASFPYTADESDLIRRMVSEAVFEIACPRCMEPVQVPEPIIAGGSPVWEIQCEHCNCAATISSLSAAVMVVAADAMMRDALSLVLAKAGHQIFEASNGGAALRTYQRYAPDVVITDIYLDDMDGVDFTRRLLRFDSQAKVIAVAGPRRHGAPDPLATAKRLGATQILRKPFPPDDMLTMVNSVLRGD